MVSDNNFHNNEQVLASPGIRYIGQSIDFVISAAIFMFLLWITPKVGFEQETASLISIFTAVLYFLFSDGLPNGQSLGKKLLGISVISTQSGNHCSFTQSFFRNLLTPVIGTIDAIFILGKKRQRLGDKLAKTVVVKIN
ncbi:RDD domain containing protein [Vibrio sp. N418]|uniref:RDD family protein n=1 Tax=Vibrio sp. (strain N418) TaxID=701176 RepID=UPI00021BFA0F|nr:RDD family protein [Vibrio sp. N418]EGU37322.1 RDD domain containing protein [Vibrio sp. N418]